MNFDVLTLFPEMFEGMLKSSIIGRAVKNKKIKICLHNLRQWAWNSYGAVDDKPYGGGVGMLIRVDVVDKAIKDIKKEKTKVILTSARGKRLTQADLRRWAKEERLLVICGHYEGFDERVKSLVDEEISIGDYVLTGGEIPAMTLIDGVSRLLSGVLGKDESSLEESFAEEGQVEYPQYTRPEIYNGQQVPEVLLSGDPKKIKEWQQRQSKPAEPTVDTQEK